MLQTYVPDPSSQYSIDFYQLLNRFDQCVQDRISTSCMPD